MRTPSLGATRLSVWGTRGALLEKSSEGPPLCGKSCCVVEGLPGCCRDALLFPRSWDASPWNVPPGLSLPYHCRRLRHPSVPQALKTKTSPWEFTRHKTLLKSVQRRLIGSGRDSFELFFAYYDMTTNENQWDHRKYINTLLNMYKG